MDALGVKSWAKTSDARGLHLLVGIVPEYQPEYQIEEVHAWAIFIDRVPVELRPDLFSMDYTNSRRTEKVLLDHNQAGYGRTTASIYSVRPLPGTPVSAPVAWEEVNHVSVDFRWYILQRERCRLDRISGFSNVREVLSDRYGSILRPFQKCEWGAP